MSYNPQNPNGQATSANSAPVVIASDQSALPVSLSGGATAANQTNGTQQTLITDGTDIANVVSPGTAQSNGNALLIAPTTQSQTFSFTSVTAGTAYDVGNYTRVSVHIVTLYTGTTPTVAFQTSNDNTNWVGNSLTSAAGTFTAPSTSTTTASTVFEGTIRGRYFRLNMTGAYTSGTTAGTIVFSTGSTAPVTQGVTTTSTAQTVTTGSITTSSTAVTTGALTAGGFSQISIHGTYAGVSFGITVSDDSGTTFYPVSIYDAAAQRWLAPGATLTPGTNGSKHYWVSIPGATTEIKVLASAYTSGTGSIRIVSGYTSMPPSDMTQIQDAAGNNRGVNVDANNAMLVDPGSATAVAAPALAMEQGAIASTSLPTATGNGQLTGVMSDKFGRQVILNSGTRDIVGQQSTTITSSTSPTTVITAVASTFTDISSVVFANSSASGTLATLSDGTNSYYFYVPAGETRGAVYHVPLSATTVNTAWTVTCGTSIASLFVTTHYIKNQ